MTPRILLVLLLATTAARAADGEAPVAEAAAPVAPGAERPAPLLPTPPSPQPTLFPLPTLLDALPPVWPEAAAAVGSEGLAAVLFTLDARGAVVSTEVLRDPGAGLGGAFATSLKDAVFEPTPIEPGTPAIEDRRYVATHRWELSAEQRARLHPPDPAAPPPPEPEDELTSMPLLVQQVPAIYPEAAREAGITGSVTLELDVSDRGTLDDVRLLSASPAGWGLEVAAVRAVWQYGFQPAFAGPAAVPVRITYTYRFELETRVIVEEDTQAGTTEQIDLEGPVNFTGFVRERGTRKPLGGIDVLIEDLSHSVLTDERGGFEFRGVPAGLHRVLVAIPGYEKFDTEEEVVVGRATDVVYYVRESPLGVPETIVRTRAERKEVAQRTIRIETIERIPGTFGDPVKVVQNLPGVARSPFDFGLLIVRGSGPEDSGVHIDGIRVPQLFHFGGLRSILTPILLDNIEFFPGGYGPAYGRLTGGVLDVGTKRHYEDSVHGLLQADLIDASVAVTGPIPRKGGKENLGGFVVAARRSYLDVVLPALAPSTFDLSRTIFPQWTDVQGKVAVRPNKDHDISLLAYWSQDRAATRIEDPGVATNQSTQGDFSVSTDFWRVNLDWSARANDRVSNRLLFAVGQDVQRYAVGQFADVEADLFWWMLRDEARLQVDEHLSLRLGVDAIVSKYDFSFEFANFDVRTFGNDPNVEREPLSIGDEGWAFGPAGFAEARLSFLEDRIKVIPGVRVDGYAIPGQFGFATVDPRFSFRLSPDLPWKGGVKSGLVDIKGSAGIYHQNPQGYEISESTGNTELLPEESFQFSLGTEFQFTDFLSLDVQGFYKRLDKLVVFQSGDVTTGGSDAAWVNAGDGHIWGAEVFLRWEEWKNFEGWISFTYQRSRRRDRADEDWYWFDFDQPIILDVVASYKLPYGFRVGGRFRYVSGNPQTPLLDSIYDSDGDSYIGLYGGYNTDRLPNFQALDIRIDKDIVFPTWKLTVYLDIQNVYNHKNPEQTVYNFDYTEKAYLYGLPILPNLGFKAQF